MSTNFDSDEFPMDRLKEMRARLGALGRDLPNAVNNDFAPPPTAQTAEVVEQNQPQEVVAAEDPDVWASSDVDDDELAPDTGSVGAPAAVDSDDQGSFDRLDSAAVHPEPVENPGVVVNAPDVAKEQHHSSFEEFTGISDIDAYDSQSIWEANDSTSNVTDPALLEDLGQGRHLPDEAPAAAGYTVGDTEITRPEVVNAEDVAPSYQVPPAQQFTAPVIEQPVKPEYTYPNPLSQNGNPTQAPPRTVQGFRNAAARNAANNQAPATAGYTPAQPSFSPVPVAGMSPNQSAPAPSHQQPGIPAPHPRGGPHQGFAAQPNPVANQYPPNYPDPRNPGGGNPVMPPQQHPAQYAPAHYPQQQGAIQNPAPQGPAVDQRYASVQSTPGVTSFAPMDQMQQGPQPALIRARKNAPKQSWRAIANSRFHLPVGKGADEITYDNQVDQINKGYYSPRKIAVLSLKGGVGKTTTTTSLGSTFAEHYRDGAIAAIDAAEGGTLHMRVKERRPGNIKAFAADPNLTNDSAVGYYLATNSHRLRVLRSAPEDPQDPLNPNEYLRAVSVLSVGHRVIFVDMDPSMAHPCFQTILGSVDAMVLVSSTAADSIQKAKDLLAWMRLNNFGGLHDRTMVIINHQGSAKPNIDLKAEVLHFQKSERRETLEIPWDDHLAEAGPVDLDLLNKGTRRQLVTAAAVLSSYLPTT